MPKAKKRTKVVKENDSDKPALSRFTPVIIPEVMSRKIMPEQIFDPIKGNPKAKPKVTPKGKSKGKSKGKD
tara:strand:- start:246 stop:458 length:213 start_codon:yes stop_codon:yes gene_type:complete